MTIIQNGYAFLEEPKEKNGTRENYQHAWVEPIFCAIKQSPMSDGAWWKRITSDSGIFWIGDR